MMISQSVLIFHPLRLSVLLIDWMWSFWWCNTTLLCDSPQKALGYNISTKILCQPSQWNALKWQNSAQLIHMKVYSNYVRNKRDGHNCRENVEVQGGGWLFSYSKSKASWIWEKMVVYVTMGLSILFTQTFLV